MKLVPPTVALGTSRPFVVFALTALSILGNSACKSSSTESEASSTSSTSSHSTTSKPRTAHADIKSDMTATATVTSIDKTTRLIMLRREDGKMIVVAAGPDVRNFDQITAGDTLRVRYEESLSATLQPAGTPTTPPEGALAAGRAKAGAMPAGGVGFLARARVKIESIDMEKNIVVFSLSGGELSTVRASRPEGKEFIKKLEVGDVVQLDYSESMALSIDKL